MTDRLYVVVVVVVVVVSVVVVGLVDELQAVKGNVAARTPKRRTRILARDASVEPTSAGDARRNSVTQESTAS